MDFYKLIDKVANSNDIKEIKTDDLVHLLQGNEDETLYLFKRANQITKKYMKDEIQIRAIIEFSNYCRCKCLYCGLNCNNKKLKRYRMSIDEILQNAKEAYDAGYKTMVLQSGEDMWYTKEKITYIIKQIKKIGDIAVTLSVGERSYDEYKDWRCAGADRFLIKQEIADEKIYNMLHPHSNFKNRIQCLKWLNELGYQSGSGFMIGLPFETPQTIAKNIILLKKLNIKMAGIGPFISHPDTELCGEKNGSILNTLKAVAITRILLKDVHLPATTALGVMRNNEKFNNINSDKMIDKSSEIHTKYQNTINKNSIKTKNKLSKTYIKSKGVIDKTYNIIKNNNESKIITKTSLEEYVPFFCGANVIMKKVEPIKYRNLYEIYPKPIDKNITIRDQRIEIEEYIKSLGLKVGMGRGDYNEQYTKI